jgi:predicted pyridoxine 5'-phosphate oxidase superfamily flavin-nucleotide-binding protein
MEENGGFETRITEDLAAFVAEQDSFFLATANDVGQPYIQHRGGPKGFLRVLSDTTLAFADYRGNRQYISIGNISDNAKVHLFLIDYTQKQRIKIWGEASVVDTDPALLTRLMPEGYDARPERAIVVRVLAWDANCPQHIPRKLDAEAVATALAERDRRIADLERRLRRFEAEPSEG